MTDSSERLLNADERGPEEPGTAGEIADLLRVEAERSTRPGQYESLYDLAERVEILGQRLTQAEQFNRTRASSVQAERARVRRLIADCMRANEPQTCTGFGGGSKLYDELGRLYEAVGEEAQS